MGNYVVFDEPNSVTKVLFYNKETDKTSLKCDSLILDDSPAHPTKIESMFAEKIDKNCSEYSPHFVKTFKVSTFNQIKALYINHNLVNSLNSMLFYPKITIITSEKCAMDLQYYIEHFNISDVELIEIIFQIFFTLYTIRLHYAGFVHGDLIVKNILMCENVDYLSNSTKYYEYIYNGLCYYVPIRKYIPKIWDFEFSRSDKYQNNLIGENHMGIKNDIYRFLISLFYDLEHPIVKQPQQSETTVSTQYGKFNVDSPVTDIPEPDTFIEHFKKINISKYGRIFNQFQFLQSPPDLFLERYPEFSIYVPSLNGIMERLDQLGNLRNDHFDKNNVFKSYPNVIPFYNLVKNIKTKIKLINFDFDKTLTNNFFSNLPFSDVLNGSLIDNKDVKELFNNNIELRILFEYLIKVLNIKICIISFGNKSNIVKILTNVFGDLIKEDDVIGTDVVIKCNSTSDAKNTFIVNNMKKYNVLSNDTIFFDDEIENITCAKILNIHTALCPKNGLTAKMIIDTIINIV
jgi:hypothetical protein